MILNNNKDKNAIASSMLWTGFILFLHVFLLCAIWILVIFFRGIVNYMIWIFLGVSAVIIASGYLFYRRMKTEGKTLNKMLSLPLFSGRAVEVNLLGGLVSLKIGGPGNMPALISGAPERSNRLESPGTVRIRELTEISRLLEDGLITLDEYNLVKRQILKL